MDRELIEKALSDLAGSRKVASVAALLVKTYKGGFRVLDMLAGSADPLTPSQLALSCGVSTARMTVVINNLCLKGYVRKHRRRSDRRSLAVSLTTRGKEALSERRKALERAIDDLTSGLSENELEALVGLVSKLVGRE